MKIGEEMYTLVWSPDPLRNYECLSKDGNVYVVYTDGSTKHLIAKKVGFEPLKIRRFARHT